MFVVKYGTIRPTQVFVLFGITTALLIVCGDELTSVAQVRSGFSGVLIE
jgi:hypothetical protein